MPSGNCALSAHLSRHTNKTVVFVAHVEKIGNVTAGALLGFFVEEIGPVIYNLAVAQVQERLQMRVMEVDLEINESEFQYWRKHDTAKKKQ